MISGGREQGSSGSLGGDDERLTAVKADGRDLSPDNEVPSFTLMSEGGGGGGGLVGGGGECGAEGGGGGWGGLP